VRQRGFQIIDQRANGRRVAQVVAFGLHVR
jgi:hypothetical protein